jgi:hypothetical protein
MGELRKQDCKSLSDSKEVNMGERLVDLVLNATPEERTKIYLSLNDDEKYALSVILDAEIITRGQDGKMTQLDLLKMG